MVSRRPSAATEARDPSVPVDYETVIATAADIADGEGWAAVTLSRVARAVDRHVTSMYSHVDSVAALRRGVALLAATEMAELLWGAALGRSREDALHAIADVYRSYPRDHPGRGEALLTYRGWEDDELHVQAMRMSEPLRATLRSFGLDDTQVEHAHRVFSATLRGFTTGEAVGLYARGDPAEGTYQQILDLFVLALSSGQWPDTGSARRH